MSRRRRRFTHSTTVALCVSLAAHGAAMLFVAWWVILHPEPAYVVTDAERARVVLPPPPIPPSRPRRPRPPPEPFDQPKVNPRDDSGEADGHGTANRSTPGDRPMTADRGYEQADLARSRPTDPSLIDAAARQVAQAGRPTESDALPIQPAHAAEQRRFATPSPAAAGAASGAPRSASHALGPLPPTPPLAAPADPDDAPPPIAGGSPAAADAPAVASAPPPKGVRGRLAADSDTESMPFARDATVEFHAGQVAGRQGLKVQMYEPRWGMSAYNDIMARSAGFRAVFGVRVRPDGSVSMVEPLVSSGSDSIDQDCERSLYADSFEARKDKAGRPQPTLWTVVFN